MNQPQDAWRGVEENVEVAEGLERARRAIAREESREKISVKGVRPEVTEKKNRYLRK